MTLARATGLAATACVLELAFSLVENVNAMLRADTLPASTAAAGALMYLPPAFFCLFLLALYFELANRSSFLSVRVCAFLAALGYASMGALTIYRLLAHKMFFGDAYQSLQWSGLFALRICWIVLCGMFAAGARPPGNAAIGNFAVVAAVLQGLTGLRESYYHIRNVAQWWTGRSYQAERLIPWGLAGVAIGLFVWCALCMFLIEVWRNATRQIAASTSALPRR
jgi:hypothetical protein